MSKEGGKYRLARLRTRLMVGRWLVVIAVALTVGCTGFASPQSPDENPPQRDMQAVAEDLYAAMGEVFAAQTQGVDLMIEQRLMVVSLYEPLDEAQRRRFVGRVVPVGRGVGVEIRAQYQRAIGAGADGSVFWEEVPEQELTDEAKDLELRLAREVERHYHRSNR